MKYNEWRDELQNNLLSVSDAERRRVLDYYAEAYADRREAGFSEREIIQDFGAPYDAAQRILYENKNDGYYDGAGAGPAEPPRRETMREDRRRENYGYAPPPPPPLQPQPAYAGNAPAAVKKEDHTWVFVLLCIIFAVPLFGLVMAMVGITIGFCVAPAAVVGSGVAVIAVSIVEELAVGEVALGFFDIGLGLIISGLGIILCPLFFKLVGLMWKLFNMFFKWLRSLFSGKERV